MSPLSRAHRAPGSVFVRSIAGCVEEFPGAVGVVGIFDDIGAAAELRREAGRVQHARAALHDVVAQGLAIDAVGEGLPDARVLDIAPYKATLPADLGFDEAFL